MSRLAERPAPTWHSGLVGGELRALTLGAISVLRRSSGVPRVDEQAQLFHLGRAESAGDREAKLETLGKFLRFGDTVSGDTNHIDARRIEYVDSGVDLSQALCIVVRNRRGESED